MQMRNWVVFFLSGFVAIVGCERGAPAPAHDHAAHDHAAHDHAAHDDHAVHEKPAVEERADEPVGPKIETGSFQLAMAPADDAYRVGKTGQVRIELEGRGPWHVNQEYPIRVDLSADPAVKLTRQELVKDDAQEFGDERVRFLAGVEPSEKGTHEVSCEVSFAMCTEENCVLEKRKLAIPLEVQ